MKIAVVTGASSGMGREMVIQLADRFAALDEIWVIARRKERLEQLETEVPVPLRIFPIDLQKSDQLAVLERALKEERPKVKILVNSAGYGKIGRVGEISLQEETGMVALNCQALCAVTHVVLPYMTPNSRIIQLASSAAFLPQPRFAIYAATKAFVLSYSRALQEELKDRNIRVTAVCPGPVDTEFFPLAESTGKPPLYKRLVMADPRKVVRKAIKDSMMGKDISVYGGLMNAFFVLSKILPHKLLIKIAAMLY